MRSCQVPLFKNLVGSSTPPSPSRKGGGGAQYVRFRFVKKTSMLHSVENPGYIKCYSSSSPSNSIQNNCQKICTGSRRPKTILEIRKKPHFSRWSTILLLISFSKNVTNHRKKTNRKVVFNSRPLPNILKYRDHWWDLPTIWKIRLFQTHIEEIP